jgi:hypothetical protein
MLINALLIISNKVAEDENTQPDVKPDIKPRITPAVVADIKPVIRDDASQGRSLIL